MLQKNCLMAPAIIKEKCEGIHILKSYKKIKCTIFSPFVMYKELL